jgi:hypothetical protein
MVAAVCAAMTTTSVDRLTIEAPRAIVQLEAKTQNEGEGRGRSAAISELVAD